MYMQDESNKTLLEMYDTAVKLLNSIGLNKITVKRICLNSKLTTTYGCYDNKSKVIEISKKHFLLGEESDVMNTIIHEISHNICDEKFGYISENGGHSNKWNEIADYITNNTSFKIQRFNNFKEKKDKLISMPIYLHEFKCKNCGYSYITHSKFQDPNKIKKKKCVGCLVNKEYGYISEKSDGDFECVRTKIDYYKHEYK